MNPDGDLGSRGEYMRLVDDDTWAILTIAGEALGEPLEGKVAVAEVIRNRMKRRYASDGTVIGTVLRAKQFSMWDDHARLLAANADDDHPRVRECVEAWKLSATTDITGGAVLYHTIMIDRPYWAKASSVEELKTIGRHVFYDDRNGA
jgi:spore germination cell wall hydrolase CwlJ-like protein